MCVCIDLSLLFFVKEEEDKRRFDEKLAACVKARGTKRDSLSTRVLSAK